MRLETIEMDESNCFSSSFLDYIKKNKKLSPFYNLTPNIESFEQQIKSTQFPKERRTTIVNILKQQYSDFTISDNTAQNIDSIENEKTFTVVTGHQLNIFTGPLYFIYKIVTVINTCTQLKKKYPQYNFVPVYWMATEDHDFEEISHFRLDGEKYHWRTDQKGAVGRFDPHSLKEILDKLPGQNDVFEKAYLEHETLADAVRYYVNELFGSEGLVVIDADDKALKQSFVSVIKDDVINNSTKSLVENTNGELKKLGYPTQVFARDINFFYIDGDLRSRIVKENGKYTVLDTDLAFTEDEIITQIETSPEKFSPNVILRPLYQEWVLPNLAYVGGPSEVVYWLQLKEVFESHNTPFPILMPRNFGLVVSKNDKRKIDKLNFDMKKWFLPTQVLIQHYVSKQSNNDLSYKNKITEIKNIYNQAKEQASVVDVTLLQHLEALQTKTTNLLEKAEKKLLRAEKRHHDTKIKQIEGVKNKLFPNDNLQERTDNFLNFYQDNPQFIKDLIQQFDPFNYKFHVLLEE
ncbi:MAG: bacillithiol biosynthesis cysteine-adding enzyme BshC [Cyclobacteriaceae bacterium]|nr:bacillithiol biosynthesis cysteine-adding enzyme BshC [Cyclobacteriaceae bacterium]